MLPLLWIGAAVVTGVILSTSGDDKSKENFDEEMKFREVSEGYVRNELTKHGKTLPQ